MITKFDRYLLHKEHGLHYMRKGEPWCTAKISMYLNGYTISYLIHRKNLFKPMFKTLIKDARQKLLDKTNPDDI